MPVLLAALLVVGGGPAAAAPSLPLRLEDGSGRVTLLSAGEPLALLFWASWCRPCRPLVAALGRARVTGVRIVLVDELVSETDGEAVKAEVARLGLWNPVLYDRFGEVGDRLDVRGLPTLCLFDGRGRLARCEMGAMTAARALELVRALA